MLQDPPQLDQSDVRTDADTLVSCQAYQASRAVDAEGWQHPISVPFFNVQHNPEGLVHGGAAQYSDESRTAQDLNESVSFFEKRGYKTIWSNEITERSEAVPRLQGGAAFLQPDNVLQVLLDGLLGHTSKSGVTQQHQKYETLASNYVTPVVERFQLSKLSNKRFRGIIDSCFGNHYGELLDSHVVQAANPDLSLDQHLKQRNSSLWLQLSSQDTTARGVTFMPVWRAVQDDATRNILVAKFEQHGSIDLPSITPQMPTLLMLGTDMCKAQIAGLVQDKATSLWFFTDKAAAFFQFAASLLCGHQQGYLCSFRVFTDATEKKMRQNPASMSVHSCVLTQDRDGDKLGIFTVAVPDSDRLVSVHIHFSPSNNPLAGNMVSAYLRLIQTPASKTNSVAWKKASASQQALQKPVYEVIERISNDEPRSAQKKELTNDAFCTQLCAKCVEYGEQQTTHWKDKEWHYECVPGEYRGKKIQARTSCAAASNSDADENLPPNQSQSTSEDVAAHMGAMDIKSTFTDDVLEALTADLGDLSAYSIAPLETRFVEVEPSKPAEGNGL